MVLRVAGGTPWDWPSSREGPPCHLPGDRGHWHVATQRGELCRLDPTPINSPRHHASLQISPDSTEGAEEWPGRERRSKVTSRNRRR